MGGGTYSYTGRVDRSVKAGYTTLNSAEIFTSRSLNNAMSPYNVKVRESRDSAEHPDSLAIIIALDVTGSMGSVPHFLVKEGLPEIMDAIIKGGIADPQVLFVGIGDHTCDQAPLQVGQFESSDELLDHWLTTLWLEGKGGGNDGESYLLAWYFAAYHTAIDCFEKRKRKGFLITIGDEPCLDSVSKRSIQGIMGANSVQDDLKAVALLEKAREKYNVFHINICETPSGGRPVVEEGWKQLMRDDLILAQGREHVASIITQLVCPGAQYGQGKKDQKPAPAKKKEDKEMML